PGDRGGGCVRRRAGRGDQEREVRDVRPEAASRRPDRRRQEPGRRRGDREARQVSAIDPWVNLVPAGATAQLSGDASGHGAETLFGEGVRAGSGEDDLLAVMNSCDVGTAVLTAGLSAGTGAEDFLAVADRNPGRFLVAGMVIQAADAEGNAERVRELAKHPRV